MSKGMQKQLGILLLDLIVISGLIYGGVMAWLSLTWLWFSVFVFAFVLVRGNLKNYYKKSKSSLEILALCIGSSFVLYALYFTGHMITLSAMLIVDVMIFGFIISNNKNLKELNHE